jgi:hypothetical protein
MTVGYRERSACISESKVAGRCPEIDPFWRQIKPERMGNSGGKVGPLQKDAQKE